MQDEQRAVWRAKLGRGSTRVRTRTFVLAHRLSLSDNDLLKLRHLQREASDNDMHSCSVTTPVSLEPS
eukprot:1191710-Pyramimonas_sp.AAC.1